MISSHPSDSASTPMALLIPKPLRLLVTNSGAEVIVERRNAGQKRLFVHLLDEVEREEVLRRRVDFNSSKDHILEELRWARATLWEDVRLQRYLYSADWLTWPSFEELSSMVDLVRSAKETDEVPDFVGANSLKKALDIVGQEMMYPGLHPLKEETLSGPLLAFESTKGDGCTTGETLEALGTNNKHCIGSSVWVLDLNTPSFTIEEIIRLPLTTRVRDECVRLIQPSLSIINCDESWDAIMNVHRQRMDSRIPGIFYGIPDSLLQFGLTAEYLAKNICESAEQKRRVRLRVGVYLTIIHRYEVYVLIGATPQGNAGRDETIIRKEFERVSGLNYNSCRSAGLILFVSEGETLDEVLHLRFLSPLAASHNCLASVGLTEKIKMIHVTVEHNPFVIIHGPRVVGKFPDNKEARAILSDLLLSREGAVTSSSTPPLSQSSSKISQQQQGSTLASVPTSATLTGEQLRKGVDEAVFKTLSQEPMTKVALSSHVNMLRFKGLANFEAVLKDSLKRHAEYRGRKYYLKE